MLRIEKLFLQGFKSFCDPTEVVFDLEGITAVVGPNGCGKSNVSDAINWVIGQQSAKALRGGKMEDVIFQGSRNRQPAGMAEVTLTMLVTETFEVRSQSQPEAEALKSAEESLDQAAMAVNAAADAVAPAEEVKEAAAPAPEAAEGVAGEAVSGAEEAAVPAEAAAQAVVEHAHAEGSLKRQRQFKKALTNATPSVFQAGERVVVGRRLFRTGESEYELNGRTCRLRDVQELFAGTGLGGAHYAIIEQGRIGQVLSAKPLDRRSLIEEAAGISKFKMRQHTAELKLEASKTNLSRLTDIIAEIERQQNSLKRQAQRARRYKRLRQEMRDLMRAVYVVDYRVSNKTLIELAAALSEISGRETHLTTSIARAEETQTEAAQTARLAEETLNETRQLVSDTDIELVRSRQQQTYLTGQIRDLSNRAQQFARDQANISERNRVITQEIERLREELRRIEEEINTESRQLAEEENRHRELVQTDGEAESRLEVARKKVMETVTTLERWRQLLRQFTDAVDRSDTRLSGLRVERERAQLQAQTAQENFAGVSESLEIAALKQRQVADSLAGTISELAEQRRVRDERQATLAAQQRELTGAEQRLGSLAQIDDRRTYFSESVQTVMKHSNNGGGFKALGTLADFVTVNPEHEAMIETVLREELQFVVVPSFDDALRAIEILKAEDAGRATFLVIGPSILDAGRVQATFAQNGHMTLDSILGLKPELAEAFKLAMPGLAKASVVEDARQIHPIYGSGNGSGPHVSLTQSGERIVAGRLVTGGSMSDKGIGVLTLKREIGELQERIEGLTENVEAAQAELDETLARIGQLEETQRELDGQQRQIEQQLAVQREQLQQATRDRERTATHIRVVEQETAQAETEREEFDAKLRHATAQTEEADAERNEADTVVAALQADMAELRRNAENRVQELSRRRADFATRTERRRGLQNDIRRLENEAADLSSRLSRSHMEALEAEGQAGGMQATLAETVEQIQILTAQQQRYAIELERRTAALAAAREKVDSLEIELRAAREAASQTRESRASREIEQARLSSNLDHLIQACQTELGENIAEVVERLELNRQAIEEELARHAEDDDEAPRKLLAPRMRENDLSDDGEESGDLEEIEEDESSISFWQVPDDFDLESAKVRLEALRGKIDAIGPVNMMALEELVEVEERYVFLSGQKSDIERAIADTQSAISEIKKRSRERFVEAFHAINENFKVMFVELFGGGQGEMRLIDETDVLESGIEIIAQPPGKRLQNVLLLSGGEKAMSAMALVLAIFKYRPSPFCLLDEVDAPLDEVNIGRFADKVLEMSQNTQFMIITHSKRTMEAARTLYGVTMEDPGVSKLISVKLT
ncbi:MAG: chromosome segregation protein SMC [Blastocatellia bacterium]|nr:chromosome segregation protein SMC [Blastocatellia bacterium]